MKLVFVPIGYNDNNYDEFKNVINKSLSFFISSTSFNTCKNPYIAINLILLNSSDCELESCNGIDTDCQDIVKACANLKTKDPDVSIGICKGTACGKTIGLCGSSDDIPGKSLVVNSDACSKPNYQVFAHEPGHVFGLYHVKSSNTTLGCYADEEFACLGPNAPDCKLSAVQRSRIIMTYCYDRDNYGIAGSEYLEKSVLNKYVGVCK